MVRFRRTVTVSDTPSAASTSAPLNEAESRWRDGMIEVARLLAEEVLDRPIVRPSLKDLDVVVTAWFHADERMEVNPFINAIGLAFGDHLARDASLTWAVVTDGQGTELALTGQPGDIRVYPANAVAKRIVEKHALFLVDLHAAMTADIALRRAPE